MPSNTKWSQAWAWRKCGNHPTTPHIQPWPNKTKRNRQTGHQTQHHPGRTQSQQHHFNAIYWAKQKPDTPRWHPPDHTGNKTPSINHHPDITHHENHANRHTEWQINSRILESPKKQPELQEDKIEVVKINNRRAVIVIGTKRIQMMTFKAKYNVQIDTEKLEGGEYTLLIRGKPEEPKKARKQETRSTESSTKKHKQANQSGEPRHTHSQKKIQHNVQILQYGQMQLRKPVPISPHRRPRG